MKRDGLGCLWKWNSSKLFVGPLIRVVGTLYIAFSWLPFPIGQVPSQVWCRLCVDHTLRRTSEGLLWSSLNVVTTESPNKFTIIKRFPFTLQRRNLKTHSISLDLCLWTGAGKSPLFRTFVVHTKTQGQRFHIPQSGLKSGFREALFSWRICVYGRPNRECKAVFSNFSGVVWSDWLSKKLKTNFGRGNVFQSFTPR